MGVERLSGVYVKGELKRMLKNPARTQVAARQGGRPHLFYPGAKTVSFPGCSLRRP